jgi:hypothetical protein
VIISGLLSRRYELNKNITSINNGIEKVLENKQNTSFIHHENISTEKDFYNNKHLNERGVKFYTKNIKGAYFNTKPKKMPYIRKNPNPYPTYKGNIPQHTYPLTFNLKYPIAPNYHHRPFAPILNIPPPNMLQDASRYGSSKPLPPQEPTTKPLPTELIGLIIYYFIYYFYSLLKFKYLTRVDYK